MKNIPKTVKFKKIGNKETLFVQNGLVSNKHWIFSTDWLLSLSRKRDLGMIGLCQRVSKALSNATMRRLKDEDYPTFNLEGVLESLDMSEYRPASRIEYHYGFVRGDSDNWDVVRMSFGVKNSPSIDVEYGAAIFFDSSTVILVGKADRPVLLQNSSGKIVAAIAALSPEKLKGE